MTRWACFLRGVNVGGRGRLPMALLREAAADVGGDVRTYLQSGNVALSADADPAAALRAAVAAAGGLDVPVVSRTHEQLAAVVTANPLPDPADPSRLFVSFCERPVGDALAGLDPSWHAPEELGVVGREIYAWLPDGMHRAKLTAALFERRLGGVATARNWRTVLAMRDLTGQ